MADTTVENGVRRPTTTEEDTAIAAKEAAWPAEALARAKALKIASINLTRDEKKKAGKVHSPLSATFNAEAVDAGISHVKRIRITDSPETSARAITAMTLGNPTVITAPGNQFSLGDRVYISGITTGPTEMNGRAPRITVDNGNNISVDYDSTGLTAWSAGGTVEIGTEIADTSNNIIGMTPSQLDVLSIDVTDYSDALDLHAIYQGNLVNALTTVAEVEAFTSSGWPDDGS